MPGRTYQQKFVANKVIINTANAITGTTAGPIFQMNAEFPLADMVYETLNVKLTTGFSLATGGGNVVQDGGLQFLRAIFLSTPQHSFIYENIDGISHHDIMAYKYRAHPVHLDAVNTAKGGAGAGEYHLVFPFKDFESFNAADLGIDVVKSGSPTLQFNLGAYNPDFVKQGAAGDGVNSVVGEVDLDLDPGPVSDPDLPVDLMPYYGKFAYLVNATGTQVQIILAFGDRIIKRLYICQRDGTTLARLPNSVVGVNDTDRLSCKVNSNVLYVDRKQWLALQEQNLRTCKLPAMPVGMGVIDFQRFTLGGADANGAGNGSRGGSSGARLSDALSLMSVNQGTFELDVDVTAGNSPNPQLWIHYEAVKVLPLGARRVQPAPSVPSKR